MEPDSFSQLFVGKPLVPHVARTAKTIKGNVIKAGLSCK
jgi:hypothetical protein